MVTIIMTIFAIILMLWGFARMCHEYGFTVGFFGFLIGLIIILYNHFNWIFA